MQFGIFDHLDDDGQPTHATYETRLKVIETYDRLGFRSYHVAEHHFTPLGMAAAPSVFLAAVAQRTKRLRFGPLIYAVPFSHPVRLAEEIAMLDHMSGGRMEMGFGRGASPIELAYVGHDEASTEETFQEGVQVVLEALTSERLTFRGKRYHFDDVPMILRPLQQPHPPMWYGLHSPESAPRVARQRFNVVCNDAPHNAAPVIAKFKAVWKEAHGPDAALPLIGLVRHIVVAETDAAALAIARRAFVPWRESFIYLFKMHGSAPRHWENATSFDVLHHTELKGVAGSPQTVTEWLSRHIEETGANYMVGQHQFGDMTLEETQTSLELYARHVMPELRGRFG